MASTGAAHATFVTHLKEVLEVVSPTVGNIILRPRHIIDTKEVQEVYGYDPKDGSPVIINSWVISREGVRPSHAETRALALGQQYRFHTYIIRGYYELSDDNDSETTFQEKINDILDVFIIRRQKAKDSSTVFFEDTDSINVRLIATATLGGHLVHFCEIEVIMHEKLTQIDYKGIG